MARAFSLTPMSVEFEPKGKEATRSFLVENNSAEKIAVQVTMARRVIDLEGKETNPEADDDFIVYPPQLILGPNEKRTIRVTWAGDADPKAELAYRIIAEQLPVDAEKRPRAKNAMIKMLLRYLGAVYITPKDAKPALSVSSPERATSTKDKSAQLSFVLENSGTAHKIIKELKLKALVGDKSVVLGANELRQITGQNILAGSKRRFNIAWPKDLPAEGALKVEISKLD